MKMISYPWIPFHQLSELTGRSKSTWQRYRRIGIITEGIHWVYAPNTKTKILYNRVLLTDWIACGGNQNDPAHQKAIEAYLQSLPSTAA
jgi:hypothetical protein